nr:crossover junction endodeoxyribonuclease RuvC [Abyssibacter sp.]
MDPGSRYTGWGVIDVLGQRQTAVAWGCVRLGDAAFDQRVRKIYESLHDLVGEYRPAEAALEDVFVNRNAMSALKLGQARGAAMAAIACMDVPISAYPPARVKQSIVGNGRADKTQVGHMVRALLGVQKPIQADAADALAIAVCHAHWRSSPAARLLAQSS